jgi:argininosuccinate synthase
MQAKAAGLPICRAPKKIVLAYSGGLDTSVILPWLKERYPGVKLVAFAAELGRGMSSKGIEDKAYKSGADEVVVMDLRQEFAEKYCFPMLRAHAIYEQDYLLGTSIARPLIAAKQVEVARQTGADAVGHGATGKGNDQVRFELTYMALAPDLKIIAPWKDPSFELRDRESAIDYAQKHNVPDPRQQEENLQPGPQSLAHQPRRRGDRASRSGAELGQMSDDDHAAGKGAQ